MLFVHEKNLDHKIESNYNGKSKEIERFKKKYYIPMREKMLKLSFDEDNCEAFLDAAEICNEYYNAIEKFSRDHGIKSQSKFASTFLEEISMYLFKDLPSIRSGAFDVYNKGIYAGLKISGEDDVKILKKDVDFCIGKRVNLSIDDKYSEHIILPIIAVEVKTCLDATMFGEIKSSSKAIRSATPNSKTYVLMGYKVLADEHIIAARQDATLTEMFALRSSQHGKIEPSALYDYWYEINVAVKQIGGDTVVNSLGRLMYPER